MGQTPSFPSGKRPLPESPQPASQRCQHAQGSCCRVPRPRQSHSEASLADWAVAGRLVVLRGTATRRARYVGGGPLV